MGSNIQVGGFESIRNGLISQGFTYADEIFTRTDKHVQQMIINDQPISREIANKTQLIYLGEGSCENADGTGKYTIHGLTLKVNDEEHVTVWAKDWDDFNQLLHLR